MKARVHKWQDRVKIGIDGGPMTRSKFAECGGYGEVTDDESKVTCLNCLKRLKKMKKEKAA